MTFTGPGVNFILRRRFTGEQHYLDMRTEGANRLVCWPVPLPTATGSPLFTVLYNHQIAHTFLPALFLYVLCPPVLPFLFYRSLAAGIVVGYTALPHLLYRQAKDPIFCMGTSLECCTLPIELLSGCFRVAHRARLG